MMLLWDHEMDGIVGVYVRGTGGNPRKCPMGPWDRMDNYSIPEHIWGCFGAGSTKKQTQKCNSHVKNWHTLCKHT